MIQSTGFECMIRYILKFDQTSGLREIRFTGRMQTRHLQRLSQINTTVQPRKNSTEFHVNQSCSSYATPYLRYSSIYGYIFVIPGTHESFPEYFVIIGGCFRLGEHQDSPGGRFERVGDKTKLEFIE